MSIRHRVEAVRSYRIALACGGSLAATLASVVLGDDMLVRHASLLVVMWWLALVILFPPRFALGLLLGSVGLHALLSWTSETKAELTQLPLTAFDLSLAASYPAGFLDAMKVVGWQRVAVYAGAVTVLAGLVAASLWFFRQALRRARSTPGGFRTWSLEALVAGLVVAQAAVFLHRLPDVVRASSFQEDLWSPTYVFQLEREMGTIPFLYYSHTMERRGRGNLIFDEQDTTAVPDPDAIAAAAERVVETLPVPPDRLPNVVLVMMESTFDVNTAFHLAAPVTNGIYDEVGTLAYGRLRVNVVGGGSWVSEFEVLTGIDSRLFGFSGYYTHSAVAPYMRGSLVTWLRERGYRTAAYYPVAGVFYNARRAYQRYGFETFLDSQDLGFDGWTTPDSTLAAHYLEHLPGEDRGPFFAYFVLTENHAPHECRNYESLAAMPARLRDTDDVELNCELNEFLRIMQSTETALQMTERRLREIEERTGRPYLLVAYGDHQPHTFTGSGGYAHDFGPYRRASSAKEAMYRITGSVPDPMRIPLDPIPLTVLPTVISGFVTGRPDELYLGVNLHLMEACGLDPLPDRSSSAPDQDTRDQDTPDRAAASPACAAALSTALSVYRASGLFRLLGGSGSEEP